MEFVYLLKCRDNTIYTGHTKNLEARLRRHNNGENRYTKYRLPVELAFTDEQLSSEFIKNPKNRTERYFIK